MTAEISDLQKKRAYNQIWNAAANYGFLPDFRFYTPEGRPMSTGTRSSGSPADTMTMSS